LIPLIIALTKPRTNPRPKLNGAGENTHNQCQLITDVNFNVTNNAVNRVMNSLFVIFCVILILNFNSIQWLFNFKKSRFKNPQRVTDNACIVQFFQYIGHVGFGDVLE
jgi:hypothetical protein